MNHASFLARVDECLDARRDPLDDADVQAFLLEHPEHLVAIAELRACLRAISPAPHLRRRKHFVALGLTAAAVAMALPLVLPRVVPQSGNGGRGADRPVSRVFAATMREWAPRAHVAAAFEIRETLAASPATRVSVYERRSEPR